VRTLVINTYGGSLLLGASALGLEIIGSYEDVGFGQPIQRANFPHLNFIEYRKDWPAQDLSETFVIAHPPCSAFSIQNRSTTKRGLDSAAFACTRSVLEYAMSNRAVGITVESVVGTLAGAWNVHQEYADKYDYNLYRVLQNGSMFSAQWRERFWVIYVRKGAAPDTLSLTLQPRWQTVRQVTDGYTDGPAPAGLDEFLEKLKERFRTEAKCTEDEIQAIFGWSPPDTTIASVDERLHDVKFPTADRWKICQTYVTRYASSAMIYLAPTGLAPVLLGGSWWYMDGRNLSERAYKRLMGFPADYFFPTGELRKENYRADMRTYLSKGVIPAVATWILHQAQSHLGEKLPPLADPDGEAPYHIEVRPGGIADFRYRKRDWGQSRPELRHEDDLTVPKSVRYAAARVVAVPAPSDSLVEVTPAPSKPPKPPAPDSLRRLTAADHQVIYARALAGEPLSTLATEYNIRQERVYHIIWECKRKQVDISAITVPPPGQPQPSTESDVSERRRLTAIDHVQIYNRVQAGEKIRDVARAYDLKSERVSHIVWEIKKKLGTMATDSPSPEQPKSEQFDLLDIAVPTPSPPVVSSAPATLIGVKLALVPELQSKPSRWKATDVDDKLRELLFIRPDTVDRYALEESRDYHPLRINSNDILLDLGAHIGCTALRAALVGARKIISVEPEPENFALLLQNTKDFPQITCIEGAVTSEPTEVVSLNIVKRVSEYGYSSGGHSCVLKTRGGSISVRNLQLTDLLTQYSPTVIKCDIEGSELTLDWSNLPRSVRALTIEFHIRGGQHQEETSKIFHVLTQQNFTPLNRVNLKTKFSVLRTFFSRG
jgi:FkbM family methyltransferase